MAERKGFYGWYLIAALWLIYFTNLGFVYYGGSVINTFMVKSLGLSRETLGLGFTIFLLMQGGLLGPIIAPVINRRGIRFALSLGSFFIFAGALTMATLVTSTLGFYIAYGVICGFGVGFAGVLSVQTAATLWFSKKRSRALSLVLTGGGIGGFAAAPAVTAVISASDNWRAGWFLVTILSAVSFILSVLFVRNRPSDLGQVPDGEDMPDAPVKAGVKRAGVHRTSREWSLGEAVKTRSLWMIFIGNIGYLAPFTFCVGHGVIHLMDRGFPKGLAALSIGLMMLFSIVGRLIGGVLGDRIEPRFVWSGACLSMLAGVLFLMMASVSAHVYAFAVLMGTGFGVSFVQMPTIIGNYFGPAAFASIVGTIAPLYALISASAPFTGGMIYDATGSYTWAFIGVMVLCAAGMTALLFAHPHREQAESPA